jgi:rhomboid protease GluP
MPAISCHSCRKLISDDEQRCPFCDAPQRIEVNSAKLSSGFFSNPKSILNGIIAFNLIFYAGAIFLNPAEVFSFDNGILGFGSPDSKALLLLGMTGGTAWKCNHYWTLITASFLHGSLLHIYFNMSWLRQLGSMMIGWMGPARLVIAYIITGIGGFLLSNLWDGVPTIGASCSIFGLMGILIVFGYRRGGVLGNNIYKQMRIWALIGLALGFMVPMINNAGHIGGLVTGLILGFIFPKQEDVRESGVLQLFALLLLVITFLSFAWNGYTMLGLFEKFNRFGQFFC